LSYLVVLCCGRSNKSVVLLFQFGKVSSQHFDSGLKFVVLLHKDVNQPTQVTVFGTTHGLGSQEESQQKKTHPVG